MELNGYHVKEEHSFDLNVVNIYELMMPLMTIQIVIAFRQARATAPRVGDAKL